MLRRASVWDVENGRVSRENSYLAVVMRFYPRFLKRERVDEYIRDLAPPAELFSDFKEKDRKLKNHNSAFYLSNYEKRFFVSDEGKKRLAELVELSKTNDVVLICQCRDFDRCHCDLLLLWAEKHLGASVQGLIFDYPEFKARLREI
jgi:uncharacterized protein YeaO (DUF488 family)